MNIPRSMLVTAALLSCFAANRALAANFGWDRGGANDLWSTSANWSPNGTPDFDDVILLTGTSAAGPRTIDLDGTRQIVRVEANGVDTVAGEYLFTSSDPNDVLEIMLAGGNALLSNSNGGSLRFDTDILLHEPNVEYRFNLVATGNFIEVNGDVAPSATFGTTELVLTSRSTSSSPSVTVTGVISDYRGSDPNATTKLKLTAGFEPDSENHLGIVKVSGLNTYSGQTVVNGATLDFNSLTDWDPNGIASALGAPRNAADGTIRLGATDTSPSAPANAQRFGTLRYTGSGHSSNRDFQLQGAGGVIGADATATGGLTLSGSVNSIEAGLKTFELGGGSSFVNTFGGVIADGTGQVALLKTGFTTWVLSGSNTYTGGTTLTGGTLEVSADQNLGDPNGALTFNSGSTLRVTGTSFASTSRTINWQGGGFDIVDPNHTFTVNIGTGGIGGLNKIGAGKLKLEGSNDSLGSSAIREGSLEITDGSNLTTTSGAVIAVDPNSMGMVTVAGVDPNSGNPSIWTNSGILYIGYYGNGTLDITGGGRVTNTVGHVGFFPNSTGIVSVDSVDPNTGTRSTWTNSGDLYVGNSGNGTLNIIGGGLVTNSLGSIGDDPNSTGMATVAGTDQNGTPSTWTNSGDLYVGNSGAATLDITGGGWVTNTTGYVGFISNSTGMVSVEGVDPNSGTPSTWDSSGDLFVGSGGNGMLEITDGGLVENSNGYVGTNSSSTSAVTVAGTDPNSGTRSTWNNSIDLLVGVSGNGTLDITAGGLVTSRNGNIGTNSSSTSAVTVAGVDPNSGTPSTWTNSTALFVGISGDATLDITAGGLVESGLGYIGYFSSSTSAVTVTGVDPNSGTRSTWSNSLDLRVGLDGAATLDITAGGLVTNRNGTIGTTSSSTSAVMVAGVDPNSGTPSTWDSSGDLFVGVSGDGTLDITAGGLVSNTIGIIAANLATTGVVTVAGVDSNSGTRSTWDNSGSLYVGGQPNGNVGGAGTLTVTDGGLVSNTIGIIAPYPVTTGVVTVAGVDPNSGTRSTWDNSGSLYVGGRPTAAGGAGTLTVTDGGVVTVGGTLKIWSPGTVIVDGGVLEIDSTAVQVAGALNFLSGTLRLFDAAGYTVGANSGPIDDLLGNEHVLLAPSRRLIVDQTLSVPVDTSITVVAGDLTAGAIVNDDLIYISDGTLTTTSGFTNNANLVLIDSIVEGPLDNQSAVTVLGTVDFNGLVSGPGNYYGPGTANFNGGMALGASPAEVSFEGSVVLGSANTLFVDLAGTIPGSEYDVLTIAGDATLAGELSLVLDPNFSLAPGNTFDILDVAGTLSGTFNGLTDGALVDTFGGVPLFIDYDTSGVTLVATVAGDFDLDFDVDGLDFLLWQRDPNVGNLSDWEANYGTVLPPPLTAASAAVPEPSAVALVLVATIPLLSRRR